jgi:hypothetical protein
VTFDRMLNRREFQRVPGLSLVEIDPFRAG